MMITAPMPALNPTSTGSEMKLATKPSLQMEASTRIAPTMSVSSAQAESSVVGSPSGATMASSAPVRMASVVVVVALIGRDEPSIA